MYLNFLFVLLLALSSWALNPIHEASYSLVPSAIHSRDINLELGVYTDASNFDVISIPISGSFKISKNLELGAGLKTYWGDVGDNIPFLAAGAKFRLAGNGTLQADILMNLQGDGDNGISLSYWKKKSYSRVFSTGYHLRLGAFDALTRDALFAFEGAAYPQLHFSSPLSFQLGFIASSQSDRFEDFLAIDLEPALLIALGNGSKLSVSLTVGLAGNQKEESRLEVNWLKGF